MDVIALTGRSNIGKTQTLNLLYTLMIADGYRQVRGHFTDHHNNDFMDVLEKNGILVGIATQGDYSRELPKYLAYLDKVGCTKAVCACTTIKTGTVKAVNRYQNLQIPKTLDMVYSTQRITNTNDANTIKNHL